MSMFYYLQAFYETKIGDHIHPFSKQNIAELHILHLRLPFIVFYIINGYMHIDS